MNLPKKTTSLQRTKKAVLKYPSTAGYRTKVYIFRDIMYEQTPILPITFRVIPTYGVLLYLLCNCHTHIGSEKSLVISTSNYCRGLKWQTSFVSHDYNKDTVSKHAWAQNDIFKLNVFTSDGQTPNIECVTIFPPFYDTYCNAMYYSWYYQIWLTFYGWHNVCVYMYLNMIICCSSER